MRLHEATITSLFVIVILPLIVAACREEPLPDIPTPSAHVLPPGDPDQPPPAEEPPGFGQRPEHRPTDHGDSPVYATALYLLGGCEQNPLEIAVAKTDGPAALCEHVTAIPVAETDGDIVDVGLPITWTADDPSLLMLDCLGGIHHDFCSLSASRDIFDDEWPHEPQTHLIACAENICPDGTNTDCPTSVCRSVIVSTVVDLSGNWALNGTEIPGTALVSVTQDGRMLRIDGMAYWGEVHGSSVRMEIGDYAYDGHISQDRSGMGGDVIELMTYSAVGTWSATRLTNM